MDAYESTRETLGQTTAPPLVGKCHPSELCQTLGGTVQSRRYTNPGPHQSRSPGLGRGMVTVRLLPSATDPLPRLRRDSATPRWYHAILGV